MTGSRNTILTLIGVRGSLSLVDALPPVNLFIFGPWSKTLQEGAPRFHNGKKTKRSLLLIQTLPLTFVQRQMWRPNSQLKNTIKNNRNPGRKSFQNTSMISLKYSPNKTSMNCLLIALGIMQSNSFLEQKNDSTARFIPYPKTNRNNSMNS